MSCGAKLATFIRGWIRYVIFGVFLFSETAESLESLLYPIFADVRTIEFEILSEILSVGSKYYFSVIFTDKINHFSFECKSYFVRDILYWKNCKNIKKDDNFSFYIKNTRS